LPIPLGSSNYFSFNFLHFHFYIIIHHSSFIIHHSSFIIHLWSSIFLLCHSSDTCHNIYIMSNNDFSYYPDIVTLIVDVAIIVHHLMNYNMWCNLIWYDLIQSKSVWFHEIRIYFRIWSNEIKWKQMRSVEWNEVKEKKGTKKTEGRRNGRNFDCISSTDEKIANIRMPI
jgi:hypothetical protein